MERLPKFATKLRLLRNTLIRCGDAENFGLLVTFGAITPHYGNQSAKIQGKSTWQFYFEAVLKSRLRKFPYILSWRSQPFLAWHSRFRNYVVHVFNVNGSTLQFQFISS